MKLCEYCEKEHEGTFASGRFCSIYCSRGFSTKNNRKEIHEKISKTAFEKIQNGEQYGFCKKNFERDGIKIFKKCSICDNEFFNFVYVSTCSSSCSRKLVQNRMTEEEKLERSLKHSSIRKEQYKNGRKVYGGRTKWIETKSSKWFNKSSRNI